MKLIFQIAIYTKYLNRAGKKMVAIQRESSRIDTFHLKIYKVKTIPKGLK